MEQKGLALEKMFNNANSPIYDVEADIKDLIKRCGALTHEMNEYKTKAESDEKKMLLDFLNVLDAFENVFRNISAKEDSADQQTKIWIGNFKAVCRQLQRALKAAGVVPIETIIGEKADPHWHYVAEVCEDHDKDNETIVEEIKKGYLWNGKMLRATEVKAVKNKGRINKEG